MKYIYWDIDGTLLSSGWAGADALRAAVKERFGVENYQFKYSLAGCTDTQIVKDICLDVSGKCRASDVANLLIIYHRLLPASLASHNGKLHPNVLSSLQYIASKPSAYKNCLLTGNTQTGAYLKLARYQIDKFFSSDYSACGELDEDRCRLARIGFWRLQLLHPEVTANDLLIIGDTPNDAACAEAIGARSLIVLAGSSFSRQELAPANPWKIIDSLPENPAELEQILSEL